MKMESFLLGDIGPDVFYDVQKIVLKTLEEKYYQPFLASEQYAELKHILATEDMKELSLGSDVPDDSVANGDCEVTIDLANHSTYARTKLEQLEVSGERIMNVFVRIIICIAN